MSKKNKCVTGNPYATNRAGLIKAPKNTTSGEPKAQVIKGGDLRAGKKTAPKSK